jgi:hypothetical protein
MDNSKMLDIESSLEKTFIDEWISKLRIWIRKDDNKDYLYRKEVLEDILQSLENYPKSNNVLLYTSEASDIDWYEVGHGEPTEWEKVETLSMGLSAFVDGTVDPFKYVLGKNLKIYAKNKPIGERVLKYNTNSAFKGSPVEDKDCGDGWFLKPITENSRRNQ